MVAALTKNPQLVVPSGSGGWLVAGLPTLPFAVIFMIPVILGDGGGVAIGAWVVATGLTLVRPLYWRRFRRRNRVVVDHETLTVVSAGKSTAIAFDDIAGLDWVYGSKVIVQLLSSTSWEADLKVSTTSGELVSTPLLIPTLRSQRRSLTALSHALPVRTWGVSWVAASSDRGSMKWDPARDPVTPSGVARFARKRR